jgi:hypothetical protein
MKREKIIKKSNLVLTVLLFSVYLFGDKIFAQENHLDIQHIKVYSKEGRFAGWPANNGMWNWGDEILVGFVEAEHYESEGFHSYNKDSARNKYARSLDGGVTWNVSDAYDLGQTGKAYDNNLGKNEQKQPKVLDHSMGNLTSPDFILTFMRDNFHNGPSIFYYSNDRGKKWKGPYKFPDLGTPGVATRSDYIIEGPQELSAFMTVGKENGREGRGIYSRTKDGGKSWELVSWIGPEPETFEIMPSTVRLSPTEFLTVVRARDINPQRDFLKAYRSTDNGSTWNRIFDPVMDTGHNGSPPALVHMKDGKLALAYAYRSQYGSRICLRISSDNGETWSHEIPVRCGDGANADIGYPQMIQREDGKLVIVYYWNHAVEETNSPYRYIAASIVNLSKF